MSINVLNYTPKNRIFVGDEMVFRYQILDSKGRVVDVSGATKKEFKFKPPNNGTLLTKTMVFTTDGTDGYIEYTTSDSDLSVAGEWQLQAYFEGVDTFTGHSTIDIFRVFTPLS